MKKNTLNRKVLSIMLAVLMAATSIVPCFAVQAEDGIIGAYQIEIFYKDTDTIVPTYVDDSLPEDQREEYIVEMVEGEKLNLTYKLIDTDMPNNATIHWYSDSPTLADVDQNGVVKAFDSSKGAVIQLWLDNEVRTIPIVGDTVAKGFEKVFYSNTYVDIDSLDTEEIMVIAEAAFGDESVLGTNIEGYKDDLLTSLEEYLDKINTNIYVQLISSSGEVLDEDYIQVVVRKNDAWYANFLPNGTHITNKAQIPTTVAKGSEVQLYAVTTPRRLNYKVVYSIKSSSIFDQGKVVATVNDSGLVSFKNTGTVTVMVSPDTEQIIENFLKLVNYVYALDNTGTIDSDEIAGILIDYVGLDMNRTVLAGIIDAGLVIKDVTQDAVDPVQLSATAIEIISNLVLQFVYNDTIEFTVVEAEPISDFNLEGPESVREGSQVQIEVTDLQPTYGDLSDMVWTSSNPAVASVDQNGIVTGRDAGGSLGQLSISDPVYITATSTTNNVTRTFKISVTGKTGRYISDVEITGPDYLELNQTANYFYQIYPERVADADNLYVEWGMRVGEDEDGNPYYEWATADTPVTTELASIDYLGHYTVIAGGEVTIALHAYTGYQLSNGSFYEISSHVAEYEVFNGIPIEAITITVTDGTSNGDINRDNTVNINGTNYQYVTIKKGQLEAYYNNGAKLAASVYPENATNKHLTWVVDNDYYTTTPSDNTLTAEVKQNSGHENADYFNVYAVSQDGRIKSNVITVCITRKYVTSNTINESTLSLVRGYDADVTHTVGFESNALLTTTGNCCYMCNWYSSDENVFTVEAKHNDNRDATITGVDVGTATLYCVSADGGIVATRTVTVYPDKERLQNIVDLCDKTVIERTKANAAEYKQFMHKLDLAYTILYDEPLASQSTCDTYADELLYAFYKLGGFVGILDIDIKATGGKDLARDFVTVSVGSTANYKNQSYDFDMKLFPSNAMYSSIVWTSSNSNIAIDENGKCSPTSNNPAAGKITCTVTDYMGNSISDSVYVAFSKTPATGIELNTYQIDNGGIGTTQQLTATVLPTGTLGVGEASNSDVVWSSTDESIATVDANGVVTFVKGGRCKIVATTVDGGYTAECSVKVVTYYGNLELLIQQYTDLNLQQISYIPETWEVYEAAMDAAWEIIRVRDSSQDEVDEAYATLQSAYEGLEKYNQIQKIELYLDGEETKEFYQYDLRLLKEGISYKNALLDLNARIYPSNGSYASAQWISSTDDISVTTDGKCSPTANKSCYGRITCVVTDHFDRTYEDSVWVSFSYNPVTGIDLSETSITGEPGTTYQLTATVQPTGTSLFHIAAADIQDYYWESDDTSIATVNDNGLVTFVHAGSTIVRCVSYDGGIYAECEVSAEGDRTALRKAIADYAEIEYTDYAYDYGMAFKNAYDAATVALTQRGLSQEQIDTATANLINAANNLPAHPYILVDSVKLTYQAYKNPTIGGTSLVTSGTVGANDAISLNLSSSFATYNYNNYVTVTAAANPTNAMYQSVSYNVISTTRASTSINGNLITVTPTEKSSGGFAEICATITDYYGRTTSRTFYVVLSDNVCSGINVTESSLSVYAGSTPTQLHYSISGSPEFTGVVWTSSDETVATVSSSGVVTPIERGTAVITARTVDGGYSDTVTFTISTDFRTLANKYNEYNTLIENVQDEHEYTEESLNALAAVVAEAGAMINANTATQAEVNEMISALDEAYNSLVVYQQATGVSISADTTDDAVTLVNPGFVRYTGAPFVNGKYVLLTANPLPAAGALYSSVEWESSNEDITVDADGVVTNHTARAGATKITCTLTTENGATFTDTMYVSFTRYGVVDVSFDDDMVYGAPGEYKIVTPNITNANNSALSQYTVKDCIFESSNESVATVDENGRIFFVSQGSATITAISMDGGISGTITAYTTWDTGALKAAIQEAEALEQTDYTPSSYSDMQIALQAAQNVYANVNANQSQIDSACAALTTAIEALVEFIPPEISVSCNGSEIETNAAVEAADNDTLVFTVSLGENAMVDSYNVSTSNVTNTTVSVNDLTVTAVKGMGDGSFTLTVTAVDDWDEEYEATYNISLVNSVVYATDFEITAVGETVVNGAITHSCGGTYTNFYGMQLGYTPTPANANGIASVTYESSATNFVTVDENGLVNLTTAGKVRGSNTATITVTLTNSDGSQVMKTVSITITRA